MNIIRPQPVQEAALISNAKIVIFGGAKGGGKSFALRLAPLYNIGIPKYHAVIFRRSLPQCKKPGGMWDKSFEIYPALGGIEKISELKWTFPSGSTIQFSHLHEPKSWLDWMGTETAFYGFDQLEEFTQEHFLKILSCMRTTAKVETQIMATTNPDGTSWVRKLVDPWIANDGYVNPERNRKVYYFTIEDDQIKWVTSDWRDSNGQPPISCQYISADIWDNPALLESDPNYLSNLQSQSFIDRERYLGIKGRGGNWNVKAAAGKIFNGDWFIKLTDIPTLIKGYRLVRFWDFAATTPTTKKGDYTVDCLMLKRRTPIGDTYIVIDIGRRRLPPASTNNVVLNIAQTDAMRFGRDVAIRWQQDPGAAGVRDSANLQKLLAGFDAKGTPDLRDKVSRALPVSAGVEAGFVVFVLAGWNTIVFNELEQFPDGEHDDIVDAIAGAFNYLAAPPSKSKSYIH